MIAGEPDTSCPSVDTLFAKVGGYLPEDELPALEHHLAACDACGLVLAEAGRALVSDSVDEVPGPTAAGAQLAQGR